MELNFKTIMSKFLLKHKTSYSVGSLFFVCLFLMSCEKKTGYIPKSDLLNLPSLTAKDFITVANDSGMLQLKMYARIIEQYDNKPIPYSEFKSGIRVVFYEGKKDSVASVTAKYARFTKKENLWELRDSVVVINEKGDKLETELLFWNQADDRIYTDRFVKITNVDQITMGTGLESNSKMTVVKIKKVQMTLYLKDEQ
jgi:LPS export ABC transporter protein LptC